MAKRYATHAELEALYPQFANTDDALADLVGEFAQMCIGLTFYGDDASRMHVLMWAHMLWLHPNAGPTGTGSTPVQQTGTATVGESVDGTYRIIIGVDVFEHVAAGQTDVQIAVALAALIDASPKYSAPVPATATLAYAILQPGVSATVTGESPNSLLSVAITQAASGGAGSAASYNPGAIASMTDGPSSISWHAPSSRTERSAWLQLSPPGQQFDELNQAYGWKSGMVLARDTPGRLPFGF